MKKFENDVCIIGGCGHVGLPLAIMLADAGQHVCIYDINKESIETVKNGTMPFEEENAEPILKNVLEKQMLTFSSDESIISTAENVVMIIGTPVDEHLNPRVDILKKTILSISRYLNDEQLLILRSTVYPGVSKRIRDWLDEENIHCDIAFCPERILEGKAISELKELPQIVSSFTESGVNRSSTLFKLLTNEIIVVEPLEAELTKLYSNVWRYIQFAISNQFYTIANDYGVDFYNIHHAMTYNYPRCKNFPRPGFAAGPCLFKDTMQLGAFYNNNFNLGHTAMLINEGLPNYICQCLKNEYDLSKMTVGILGMSFKAESDDIRESLSYKVKKLFEFEAEKVLCSDPFVKDDRFVSAEDLVKKSDIIIIATPHKVYKTLQIPEGKKVADIWNVLGNGGKI
ncbi:MAG: nucleotide sugar dehydrogenase [Oscillospiraceae bacterium]|nr:nucleotide sugar dehydrogenase [Oscillospiraceae bacterium]